MVELLLIRPFWPTGELISAPFYSFSCWVDVILLIAVVLMIPWEPEYITRHIRLVPALNMSLHAAIFPLLSRDSCGGPHPCGFRDSVPEPFKRLIIQIDLLVTFCFVCACV